jgi:hypothetical protein
LHKYTIAIAIQWNKITVKLSQGKWKALV